MTLPVERKLPGAPISREQLVAEWEDLHHRNVMKGPVATFLFDLFDVHYSVPEKTYHWRVQLERGCQETCGRLRDRSRKLKTLLL
jgi:hypothetical protein